MVYPEVPIPLFRVKIHKKTVTKSMRILCIYLPQPPNPYHKNLQITSRIYLFGDNFDPKISEQKSRNTVEASVRTHVRKPRIPFKMLDLMDRHKPSKNDESPWKHAPERTPGRTQGHGHNTSSSRKKYLTYLPFFRQF